MKKIAVNKAETRIAKAKQCLQQIEASKSFTEFSSAWTDFLVALNGAHTILEQGAKESPQSRQWYGGKKVERRKDPLLGYLHQARNADEHGLEPIAELKSGSIEIGPSASGAPVHLRSLHVSPDGRVSGEFRSVDGLPPRIVIELPRVRLITVVDTRYMTKCDPPAEHLGSKLTDISPLAVAKLGMTYHEDLVTQAARLVP